MINKKRLKKYKTIKSNPALGLFQAIQNMEVNIRMKFEELRMEMMKEIKEKFKGLHQEDFIDSRIIKELISNGISETLKNIKGDSGNDGHTPTDSELLDIIIPLIPKAKDGETPTGEELLELIKPLIPDVKDGKNADEDKIIREVTRNIPDSKNGNDGKDGKDGSPDEPKDIVNKLQTLQGEERLDASAIKNLPAVAQFGGKTIHRGGYQMMVSRLVGTGDGTTKEFVLPEYPYSWNEVTMYVGAAALFITDDFTGSVKTVTFITAPPLDAKVRVTMRYK